MLQQAPFGFDLIKKFVILFGNTFDNIFVDRLAANNVSEQIKVPISFSAKDKMLSVLASDPDKDRQYSALLPRIGFNMIGMEYDTRRKGPASNYIRSGANSTVSVIYKQFAYVPYSFSFELYVMSKNTSDGNRIVEQILPFFQPDYTSTVELIPQMGLTLDIPIVLEDVSREDLYEGDLKVRRTMVWTMKFSLKGILAGPIYKPAMIKFIQTTFFTPSVEPGQLLTAVGVSSPLERVDIQVAELANGSPTTSAVASIPYQQININDDFGYAETFIDFIGSNIISLNMGEMVFYEYQNCAYVSLLSY